MKNSLCNYGWNYGDDYYKDSRKVSEEEVSKKSQDSDKKYCSHPKKYLNKITTALQFMVCPDCKEEVK